MKIARTSIITRLVKVPTTELTAAATLPNDHNIWAHSVLRSSGVAVKPRTVANALILFMWTSLICCIAEDGADSCDQVSQPVPPRQQNSARIKTLSSQPSPIDR